MEGGVEGWGVDGLERGELRAGKREREREESLTSVNQLICNNSNP